MVIGLFKRISQFSGGISEAHKKKYHDVCNLFLNFPVYTYACMCAYKCVCLEIYR